MSAPRATDAVRRRLALRLDDSDPGRALELARRLEPWFGISKVGMDLLVGGGPAVVTELRAGGFEVFCDFKLHDIPDQVAASARAIGRLGVSYVTMHACGGPAMLAAGVAGLADGASEAGWPTPVALGVTVLTSDPDADAFDERLAWAAEGGCGGVVCSAHEASRVKGSHPELLVVTPGIRLARGDENDQARVAGPGEAVRAGSDVLVVGRAVVDAADSATAAAAVADDVLAATAS